MKEFFRSNSEKDKNSLPVPDQYKGAMKFMALALGAAIGITAGWVAKIYKDSKDPKNRF